jgi:hypothetical protein
LLSARRIGVEFRVESLRFKEFRVGILAHRKIQRSGLNEDSSQVKVSIRFKHSEKMQGNPKSIEKNILGHVRQIFKSVTKNLSPFFR